MYLLGYDIGSSSIKAALVDASNGQTIGIAQHPESEMEIIAHQPGWAEQYPEDWWTSVCQATRQLLQKHEIKADEIASIGIAYQMHGLVLVDKDQQVLRPSIIWCDSRAVEIGHQAFEEIGQDICLQHLLNSPGNFTASKLKWVKDHEPEIYEKIDKMMLPGDYIAMKLTGRICSTMSGLSEGVLWDFAEERIAHLLLDYYELDRSMIPDIERTFSLQGKLTSAAAKACGLRAGIPVTYRAGDQPNNALSLNVLQPGEVAATGGTSGVVFGVVDKAVYDPQSRVNGFAHVNHHQEDPSIGILLCINGAGSQYRWMKQQLSQEGVSYSDMEQMIRTIPVGAAGLRIIPFGNGAERILCNQDTGAQINNLQFNRHTRAHLYRAALEGIAFSFVYGVGILKEIGLKPQMMRVGNDNLFQSTVFSQTIANLLQSSIEVINTTGAVGAAKASGVATGHFNSVEEAMQNNEVVQLFEPMKNIVNYEEAYLKWKADLMTLKSVEGRGYGVEGTR